jgi:hypothetical protein
MSAKRVYFVLLGLVAVLFVGILVGTYEVNSLLESKAKHLVNLKLQSQVVSTQQSSLQRAKKQVAEYSVFEETAKSIVPQDKDQAQAVREIANIASESGIKRLSSVTFPLSTLGGVTGTVAPTASAGKNKLTQLIPAKGLTGVYNLQITIQQNSEAAIPYSQFLTFLDKLEQNRRTAQVSSIILLPDSTHPNMVAFTLVINEFIKP